MASCVVQPVLASPTSTSDGDRTDRQCLMRLRRDEFILNLMLNLQDLGTHVKVFQSFKLASYLMSVTGSPPSLSWKRLYPCKVTKGLEFEKLHKYSITIFTQCFRGRKYPFAYLPLVLLHKLSHLLGFSLRYRPV